MAKEAEKPDKDSRDQQDDSEIVKESYRRRWLYLFQANQDFRARPVGGFTKPHLSKASSQDPNPQAEELEIEVFHGLFELRAVAADLAFPLHEILQGDI